MIPKTLFTAFVALQLPSERLSSTPSHGITPFQHEPKMVDQTPITSEYHHPVKAEGGITKVNWDGFSVGPHTEVQYESVELSGPTGFVVSKQMFGSAWEFPSKRNNAWSINPTGNPNMAIKFTDYPRNNLNFTISYWDFDIPVPVALDTTVWLGDVIVAYFPTMFNPGWNTWGLHGYNFDKITFEVQGKSKDWRDLLIIDELTYEG